MLEHFSKLVLEAFLRTLKAQMVCLFHMFTKAKTKTIKGACLGRRGAVGICIFDEIMDRYETTAVQLQKMLVDSAFVPELSLDGHFEAALIANLFERRTSRSA